MSGHWCKGNFRGVTPESIVPGRMVLVAAAIIGVSCLYTGGSGTGGLARYGLCMVHPPPTCARGSQGADTHDETQASITSGSRRTREGTVHTQCRRRSTCRVYGYAYKRVYGWIPVPADRVRLRGAGKTWTARPNWYGKYSFRRVPVRRHYTLRVSANNWFTWRHARRRVWVGRPWRAWKLPTITVRF